MAQSLLSLNSIYVGVSAHDALVNALFANDQSWFGQDLEVGIFNELGALAQSPDIGTTNLFENNAAYYTANEVSAGSYARKTLTAAGWSISGGQATYASQVFNPAEVWGGFGGWFLIDPSGGGRVLAAAHSRELYEITAASTLTVTPKVLL